MSDVARFYGLQINRSGMACCPFHNDRDPSLKVYDDHFYCFGCGATGDHAGFVAKLFGLSQIEAAKKICADFGIYLFDRQFAVPVDPKVKAESDYRMWLHKASKTISEYLTKLVSWGKVYAPKNFNVQPHPLFVESLTKRDHIEYLANILTYGSDNEKRQLYSSCREDIMKIRERLDKFSAAERTIKRKAI